MRRPTTLLTLIGLALGAIAIYLAVELRATRQELASLRDSSTAAAPVAAVKSVAARDTRAETARAVPITPASVPTQETTGRREPTAAQRDAAAQRAATLAHNTYVRGLLEHPEKRAKALRENRKNEERQLPREVLNLAEDDYNRLLDTLAASNLRYAEAMYHCNQDPQCDIGTAVRNQMQAIRLELVELLGAEKAQRLEDYRDNYQERSNVASFRGELPDSLRLSDAQAEKLVDALGEERRRTIKEWEQRGARFSGMSNMYGSLYYPDATQDLEQRVAEASEYQRRQRDRAAQVLTSGQLEVFTKQQDQMLEIARGSWEYEEQQENAK